MASAFRRLEQLYVDLDHLDQAEFLITSAAKAIADDLADGAAHEPDVRVQRRTMLSELAHAIRLATGSTPGWPT